MQTTPSDDDKLASDNTNHDPISTTTDIHRKREPVYNAREMKMPSTKDFATTAWNSFRRTITKRPRHLIGAAATVALLLAVTLTTLVYSGTAEAQQSTDATLSALTVSPRDIIGFDADRTTYSVGVASTVTTATVSATPTHSGGSAAITPDDADTMTDGHQVDLSAGANTVTITVTAEDMNTTKTYTITIGQGVTTNFGWKADEDLDGLVAAGNERPRGMCSNGTTIWILDDGDDKIYAYNTDGSRDSSNDFNTLTAAGNEHPDGLWCDSTNMWVSDTDDDKIYAYLITNKERQPSQDFNTLDAAGNRNPLSIWSDGTTMWVTDVDDTKLYAYLMSNKTRDASKDFNTLNAAGNTSATGLWSDGTTMWVSDAAGSKIYAYQRSNKARDADKDFNTLSAAGNTTPTGMWGIGQTILVADLRTDKVYSYNIPLSTNTQLSDITVGDVTVPSFIPNQASGSSYEHGVAAAKTQVTVAATARQSKGTVAITPADAGTADGHQVDLSDGANAVAITVTAQDGNTTATYTLNVNRGVTTAYGWKAVDDIDILKKAGITRPRGVWANDDTVWILETASGNRGIFAFNRATLARDPDKDIELSDNSIAGNASDIWSDGQTLWVTTVSSDLAYVAAYNLATGMRDTSQEFSVPRGVGSNLRGLWSDGETIWVLDDGNQTFFAFQKSDKARLSDLDVDLSAVNIDTGDGAAYGIWTDGVTIWVAALNFPLGNVIHAVNFADGSRDPSKDITAISANGNIDGLSGMWSDGQTIFVTDQTHDKVFTYNLPVSDNTDVRKITVDGETVKDIAEGETDYKHRVDLATTQVTVDVAAAHYKASASVTSPSDAGTVDGHQVDLDEGANTITLTVTAQDGITTGTHTLKVNRADLGADATLSALTVSPRDIIGFAADRTEYAVGVASTVTQVTISATPNQSAASAAITPADAEDSVDGHQVNLSAGKNTVTVTVTAEDTTTEKSYTLNVNQGVTTAYGWKAEDDLDGLKTAGNLDPRGIWGNSTTTWVVDSEDTFVYAYKRDGSRDTGNEFDLHADNANPIGTWSNGTTVWISDNTDEKLYAYQVSDGERQASLDLNLHTENGTATGVWSDGTTIWAADYSNRKLYAYLLDGGTRQPADDIALPGTFNPMGTWSDDVTMWVAFEDQQTIYAYNLDDGSRMASRDFTTPMAAGLNSPTGLWSNGQTMWVGDDTQNKVFAFNMPLSTDARLSSLTVSPRDIIGFDADRNAYSLGVASTVTQVTVSATPNHSGASAVIYPTDADTVTDGHQVNINPGLNRIAVDVTAEDTNTTENYTITIGQSVSTPYGWKAEDDLDGLVAAGNEDLYGMWRDATTTWVVDDSDTFVYAYNRDGSRNTGREFDLHADNGNPSGAWSNGTTVWIADYGDNKLFAYLVSNGTRQAASDISLHSDNELANGVWSNGTTIWVGDGDDKKLYAYLLADSSRQQSEEIDVASNLSPKGFWSDDTTMWVVEGVTGAPKILAYSMDDGTRIASRDFDTLATAEVSEPVGLWSDGESMWTTDSFLAKVFAFNMPPSNDARLSSLTVSPRDIIGFDTDRNVYALGVDSTVSQVTISATASHGGATVAISPRDTSSDAGHQVTLSAGVNDVNFIVTAEDGNTRKGYRVVIGRGVTAAYGWKAEDDLDGLKVAGNEAPWAIWGNATTIWVLDSDDTLVYAYNRDGSRDTGNGFDLHADNAAPSGAWSNGATVWISDLIDDKLYAYQVSNGVRQASLDLDLHDDNGSAYGVWSDGTTIWVADFSDRKLYAYLLDGGTRQPDADIDLSGTFKPIGIWSNSITMWVAFQAQTTIFAYELDDGSRIASKDFATPMAAGLSNPTGLWSDRRTMWAANEGDAKVYAFNMPGTDATLSALTVSPKNIIGFKADRTSYAVGVDHTVTQVTISGTPTDSEASVAITPNDADAVMDGHQVSLSAGANPVTVTVTSESGLAKDYTITVGHSIQTNFGWKAGDDLDGLIAASNQTPSGIWGNATTTWVVDVTDDHVYVYNRNGSRDTSREFDLHADNARAFGAWSNGQTVWISDFDDDKLYAYRVRDGMRQTSLEIDLHTDNGSAYGVWSNGTTVWVSDLSNDKLYAYGLFNGVRQPTDDITTSAQDFPQGIWSDGAIIWVTDAIDVKIYAYNLADGSRIASKDFNTPGAAGARIPTGLWSYGQTMWMADESEDKVYAFNMPRSENVNLTGITVDSTAIPSFIPNEADGAAYEHGVAPSRTQVTVTATKEHAAATVTITPSDVSSRSGHQVNLNAGANPVTITVTAEDGITTAAHTLNINRGVTGAYGWQAEHDLDGLKAAGNDNPTGIWTDGTTIWVVDYTDTYVYAYDRDGNRVTDEGFDLHADNDDPRSIWSDQTTMWVSEGDDKKIYAYTLEGGSRDTGKEFNLDSGQIVASDLWSDGDTIWVVDFNLGKLFAYVLEGGARLAEKDIDVSDTVVTLEPVYDL